MALMAVVALSASVSLGIWLGAQNQRNQNDTSALALAQARTALLAWSLAYYQKKGSGTSRAPRARVVALPCPDLGTGLHAGASAGVCGRRHHASLGLLPWRSLGTAPLRDVSRSCLWYWVSGDYKSSPYPRTLNALEPGGWVWQQGRLIYHKEADADNQNGRAHIAAVIFAPGAGLAGQNRAAQTPDCSGSGDVREYLESVMWGGLGVADEPALEDVSGHHTIDTNAGNDRLAFVTHSQIWRAALANPMVRELIHRSLPGIVAGCAARISEADGAPVTSLPASGYLRHPACSALYSRRVRDLEQHWSAGVRAHADAGGLSVGFPVRPLSAYRPRVMPDLPAPPGLTQAEIDAVGGAGVDDIWYCLRPPDAQVQPCAAPVQWVQTDGAGT